MMKTLGTLALLGALCCSGCGPSLIVQHLDPSVSKAVVWIDGKKVGSVGYKADISVSVDPGRHELKVTKPLHEENGWSDDGGPWFVVFQNDVIVTLLPTGEAPSPAAERPRGQSE